jgi:Protein of unknown function (DUF692)
MPQGSENLRTPLTSGAQHNGAGARRAFPRQITAGARAFSLEDSAAHQYAMAVSAQSNALPRDALGLGLRIPHYGYLFEHEPELGYFEIITENFLSDAAPPARRLARVCARYPVVLHGVSLNLLGHEPLDDEYLDAVCRLADRVDAAFVTDHLCWTGAHGVQHHDLLPTPYTESLVELAVDRSGSRTSRVMSRSASRA